MVALPRKPAARAKAFSENTTAPAENSHRDCRVPASMRRPSVCSPRSIFRILAPGRVAVRAGFRGHGAIRYVELRFGRILLQRDVELDRNWIGDALEFLAGVY